VVKDGPGWPDRIAGPAAAGSARKPVCQRGGSYLSRSWGIPTAGREEARDRGARQDSNPTTGESVAPSNEETVDPGYRQPAGTVNRSTIVVMGWTPPQVTGSALVCQGHRG
jgi:hypothetical protein